MSAHTTISTHVLDTALGAPAGSIPVTLARVDHRGDAAVITRGVTNADGRVPSLAPDAALTGGSYRLCFDVADYFTSSGRESFYAEICITFIVGSTAQHYHVPLLLSPFGYSTYRGS